MRNEMNLYYYTVSYKDLAPQLANATEEVIKIEVLGDSQKGTYPLLLSIGKGKAEESTFLTLSQAYSPECYSYFLNNNVEWLLTFLDKNPNYTEKELMQEILLHGLELVVTKYIKRY